MWLSPGTLSDPIWNGYVILNIHKGQPKQRYPILQDGGKKSIAFPGPSPSPNPNPTLNLPFNRLANEPLQATTTL